MNGIRIVLAAFLLCFSAAAGAQAGSVNKYYHLTPEKIAEYIGQKQGRRLVILYASWCPTCRETIPKVMEIERAEKGSVIAVSIDEKPEALIHYMNGFDEVPFPLIVVNEEGALALSEALAGYGIMQQNFIPFSALLDENGRVVEQGNLGPAKMRAFILGE